MKIYLKKVGNKQVKIPYYIKKKHENIMKNDEDTEKSKGKKMEENEMN